MTNGKSELTPGSREARRQGCKCRGYLSKYSTKWKSFYAVSAYCPLHKDVDAWGYRDELPKSNKAQP